MKVCVISCYKDGTGYSNAAIHNIMALDSVGVNVVPRSLKMTPTTGEVPKRVLELERNDLQGVDVVIQHNLPSEFSYKSGVVNVGIFDYETTGFPNTTWKYHLDIMDHIIVPCQFQKDVLVKNGISQYKVSVVSHSVPKPTSTNKIPFNKYDNAFKFYTIGEFNRRKNFVALIVAYSYAFTSDDNVLLVIKTNGSQENVVNMIGEIRKDMRRFAGPDRYPNIIVSTDRVEDNKISELHNSCNVFVTASHGEAFCIPAFEAMYHGNPIIAPNNTAFKEYLTGNDNILVECSESMVVGVNNAPMGLYTCDENWYNVNIRSLANAMEKMYSVKNSLQANRTNRINYIGENFSYPIIGARLKNVLEGLL